MRAAIFFLSAGSMYPSSTALSIRPGRVLMNSDVPSGSCRGWPSAGSTLDTSLVLMIVKMPSDRSTPSRQLSRQSKVSGIIMPPPRRSLLSSSFLGIFMDIIMPWFFRATFSRPWKTLSMSSMSAMHGTFICISDQTRVSSLLDISARL